MKKFKIYFFKTNNNYYCQIFFNNFSLDILSNNNIFIKNYLKLNFGFNLKNIYICSFIGRYLSYKLLKFKIYKFIIYKKNNKYNNCFRFLLNSLKINYSNEFKLKYYI